MGVEDRDGGVKRVDAGFGPTGEPLPRMPLRVVVFSELLPRDLRTSRSSERRRRLRIDRQSFDEVMAGLGLHAFVDVPDRLGGGKDPAIVEIEISSLKSFRPESLAERMPAARDLLRLRALLSGLRGATARVEDVRAALDSLERRTPLVETVRAALAPGAGAPVEAPREEPAASGGLDALLEKVDTPATGETSSAGADLGRLDAFVRRLAGGSRGSDAPDPRAVEGAIREIDAALSVQVDALLHHREVRRLEAAWRGLRLLVERTDFEREIVIEIVACGREQILSCFDELVLAPESESISSEPVAFVVADLELDRTPADVELARGLAERGAALSAPVLASVGAAFLGMERASELARLPGLLERLASPEYTAWRGLRESGSSRWLGAAFNGFLLRPRYAPGTAGARGFDYREDAESPLLWGSPVWAVALLAVRSFARIGWCTDMMGQRSSGTIEDLPVRLYDRPGGEAVSFPLETSFSDAIERDLTQGGIMSLSSPLDSDRAFLRFAPSVHVPQHYQDPADRARAKLQSTLPFQMFVGRLVNYAMLVEGMLVPGRDGAQIAAGYDRALRSLLGTAGRPEPDAVKVAVLPNEEDPSSQDLYLKVRWPGSQSLPGAGEVELRWPLRI